MRADFHKALSSGVPQLGYCVCYPSPGVVERVGPDWDWYWLDGQHGQLGYDQMLALVRACDLVSRPAFVRVPGHEPCNIGLALDMGATGVIVPCVDTPEEARAIVNAAKFPPLGKRSYGGRRPIDREGRGYSDQANSETLLIIQIETPTGIENVREIASLPGVDGLFLGPDDIMLRRCHPMSAPRSKETLGEDMHAVVTACKEVGIYSVMVGVGGEMLDLCLDMGFHMIVACGDVPSLANTSRIASDDARARVSGRSKKNPADAPSGGGVY